MKTNKSQIVSRVSIILISVLLLTSVFAASFVQPAFAQACKFKHKVQPGETLSSIAFDYGADWREIADANKLKEPYVLQVDQVLCIPSGSKPADEVDEDEANTSSSGPSMDVLIGLTSMWLEVRGLAKETVYNLQIGNYPGLYTIKIDRFKTNNNGYYEGWIILPKYYYLQKPKMQVCVKNVWTDEVGCSVFDNPHYQTGKYILCPNCAPGVR